MAQGRGQLPLLSPVVDENNKMTRAWSLYFTALVNELQAPGISGVADATATITGPTTIYQNGLASRPIAATKQDIFFSLDTGDTYTVNSGLSTWQLQSGPLTGDVTKPAFSSNVSLAIVNPTPGTYSGLVINNKGLVVGTPGLLASDINNALGYTAGNVVSTNPIMTGVLQLHSVTADQSYIYLSPLTGFSTTIPNAVGLLILDPAGTIASGTVTLPVTPLDGQICKISSSETITSLTVIGTSQTVLGSPGTITSTSPLEWTYYAANSTWFRTV